MMANRQKEDMNTYYAKPISLMEIQNENIYSRLETFQGYFSKEIDSLMKEIKKREMQRNSLDSSSSRPSNAYDPDPKPVSNSVPSPLSFTPLTRVQCPGGRDKNYYKQCILTLLGRHFDRIYLTEPDRKSYILVPISAMGFMLASTLSLYWRQIEMRNLEASLNELSLEDINLLFRQLHILEASYFHSVHDPNNNSQVSTGARGAMAGATSVSGSPRVSITIPAAPRAATAATPVSLMSHVFKTPERRIKRSNSKENTKETKDSSKENLKETKDSSKDNSKEGSRTPPNKRAKS